MFMLANGCSNNVLEETSFYNASLDPITYNSSNTCFMSPTSGNFSLLDIYLLQTFMLDATSNLLGMCLIRR